MKILDPVAGGKIRAIIRSLTLVVTTMSVSLGIVDHKATIILLAVLASANGVLEILTHATDVGTEGKS